MTDPLIEDDASPVSASLITFVILASLAVGTLFIPRSKVYAQGTFANTTVSVPVLTNFAGTGTFGCPTSGLGGGQCQGITQDVFPNIGQGSHFLHYCTTATALQIVLQETPDNVGAHAAQITPIYGVPPLGSCAVIQGGGFLTMCKAIFSRNQVAPHRSGTRPRRGRFLFSPQASIVWEQQRPCSAISRSLYPFSLVPFRNS